MNCPALVLQVNGRKLEVAVSPAERLSNVLRFNLGLTGTKVGCDAGDCGACTVLVGGEPVCACTTAIGQVENCEVTTIEGLQTHAKCWPRLRQTFLEYGAAQCGFCTPGMLVTAAAFLESRSKTHDIVEEDVLDALGGVLCRCTGYRKIVAAVISAARNTAPMLAAQEQSGSTVGKSIVRLDGARKVDGTDIFGADDWPREALLARVIRSPYHRAQFGFDDLQAFIAGNPGIHAVLTAKDIPGRNCFGVIPNCADQPVFAIDETRFRGEAVAMIVGEPAVVENLDLRSFPITWHELPPVLTIDAALEPEAPRIHPTRERNLLIQGRVVRGDVETALAEADLVIESEFETGFVEHAYIEPEAGFARRVGDRIEVQACTQSPYMDRGDLAAILGLNEDAVRIIPTAVGGGFGAKLDLSVQPFIALAAWHLRRAV
ncbi:MAG: molybdopterin-dependent oxidoreductase, partial [Acidobacteria bacterium]|nr:molybdopterin-dependent oxidoreductase [Acidobacteriota bacterium]